MLRSAPQSRLSLTSRPNLNPSGKATYVHARPNAVPRMTSVLAKANPPENGAGSNKEDGKFKPKRSTGKNLSALDVVRSKGQKKADVDQVVNDLSPDDQNGDGRDDNLIQLEEMSLRMFSKSYADATLQEKRKLTGHLAKTICIKKYGPDFYRDIGRKGGLACFAKYGREYYVKLSKLSNEARIRRAAVAKGAGQGPDGSDNKA